MKKLKSKTFYTIFLLLTSILVISIFIINYQSYNRERNRIRDNLTRMVNFNNNLEFDFDDRKNDLDRKIVMDYNVYTIILDENNKISDIVSHNFNDNIDINVSSIVSKIITNNKDDRLYIGNLYLTKYAFNYKKHSFVTIIDNKNTSDKLKSLLVSTLIILIIMELLILFISLKITNWIIKPAIDSFNKQKNLSRMLHMS